MEQQNRTALLIRCTREEAAKIRAAAQAERRTLSGYILNAVLNRIEAREKILAKPPAPRDEKRPVLRETKRNRP